MKVPRRLGVFGGTLDPVHYGHLDAAEAARTALALDQVWLVPSSDPPHRPVDPVATGYHRFAMAALAVQDRPSYRVSDVELRRPGRTYTMDTLRALHAEGWHPWQLFFILGTDAFAEIATWHAFPAVLDAATFVVVTRPGVSIDAAVARVPEFSGRVCAPEAVASQHPATRIVAVPAPTRDVSSTTVRARLREQHPIDDLMPAAVARHILAHHLYGAVDDLHGESKSSIG